MLVFTIRDIIGLVLFVIALLLILILLFCCVVIPKVTGLFKRSKKKGKSND